MNSNSDCGSSVDGGIDEGDDKFLADSLRHPSTKKANKRGVSFFKRGLRRSQLVDPDDVEARFGPQNLAPQLSSYSLSESNDDGDKGCDDAHVNTATRQFQEIGSRMKSALNFLRNEGGAAKLKSSWRQSRKRRSETSIPELINIPRAQGGAAAGTKPPMSYRTAESERAERDVCRARYDSLTSKLLEASRKDNFCDVEITGKSEARAGANKFLLACHSSVFEEMFYPKDPKAETKSANSSILSRRTVHVDFATQSTIEAAIHFCAATVLPSEVENKTSEANIRTVSQLHMFSQMFKFPLLSDAAYQTARRLINKTPSLACAAFDECNTMRLKADSENNWGLTTEKHSHYYDDLRAYALDFLRESPMKTALGKDLGAQFLSPSSIEAVVCDQLMDVDEYTIWRILDVWTSKGPGTEDDKISTARPLVSHIQLELIDPIQLNYQVKKCSYVNPSDVEEAIQKIELMLENESPDEEERVIVEGAGDKRVNGVYILADDDIGLKTDEAMFVKQGDEHEFGLFCWGDMWGISNCTDYSNLLYTCEMSIRKGHSNRRPPKWGWKCVGGMEGVPQCTWKPSKKDEDKVLSSSVIAPALSKHNQEKAKEPSDYAGRESLTLEQMMALPEDDDHGQHNYASFPKDFDAMANLPVDEGHEDEEGGYDINYQSAEVPVQLTWFQKDLK